MNKMYFECKCDEKCPNKELVKCNLGNLWVCNSSKDDPIICIWKDEGEILIENKIKSYNIKKGDKI